ncbi:MAG: hypothetical protein QOI26_974, partial [Pseudonocardiales bacterium]|nr:hypothetical protein [Pseudonocardiales bacterium]
DPLPEKLPGAARPGESGWSELP